MRLASLVCLSFALSHSAISEEPASIEARYNLRVTDIRQSCEYYVWLGFNNGGECEKRTGIEILRYGDIQITLNSSLLISSQTTPYEIEPIRLPVLIRDYGKYNRIHELKEFGGKDLPQDYRASTICKKLADPDGHQLTLCP